VLGISALPLSSTGSQASQHGFTVVYLTWRAYCCQLWVSKLRVPPLQADTCTAFSIGPGLSHASLSCIPTGTIGHECLSFQPLASPPNTCRHLAILYEIISRPANYLVLEPSTSPPPYLPCDQIYISHAFKSSWPPNLILQLIPWTTGPIPWPSLSRHPVTRIPTSLVLVIW
jgi:hypothetical protein